MSQSYAQRAGEHWATHRPHQLSLMPDPDVFFTELGREIQERVDVLSSHLEGPDVPGEGYLGKVGRLRMARFTAQAQALRELLPPAERDELPNRAPEHLTPTDSATFWPSSTPGCAGSDPAGGPSGCPGPGGVPASRAGRSGTGRGVGQAGREHGGAAHAARGT